MRNSNTSFVKNANRFFAIEASDVLRAVFGPAASLLRFMQSTARTYLEFVILAGTRQSRLQQMVPAVVFEGTAEHNGRIKSVTLGGDPLGGSGNSRWGCQPGLNVS